MSSQVRLALLVGEVGGTRARFLRECDIGHICVNKISRLYGDDDADACNISRCRANDLTDMRDRRVAGNTPYTVTDVALAVFRKGTYLSTTKKFIIMTCLEY